MSVYYQYVEYFSSYHYKTDSLAPTTPVKLVSLLSFTWNNTQRWHVSHFTVPLIQFSSHRWVPIAPTKQKANYLLPSKCLQITRWHGLQPKVCDKLPICILGRCEVIPSPYRRARGLGEGRGCRMMTGHRPKGNFRPPNEGNYNWAFRNYHLGLGKGNSLQDENEFLHKTRALPMTIW